MNIKVYRGHSLRIVVGMRMLAVLLLAGIFAGNAGAQTPIGSCVTISSPGEYVLTSNLSNSSICIQITSSDVILDGAGYTIAGPGYSVIGSIGVNVGGNPITNVTIKNLSVTNWYYGIILTASNSTITGNKATYNSAGIVISSAINSISNGNTLKDNIAMNNQNFGIALGHSWNNTLTGNNASNNGDGIDLDSSSNNNTLTGNNASNNYIGIALGSSSNDNTLIRNTANSNAYNGIYIYYSSSNNTLTSNTINSNSNGIQVFSSSNNNILTSNNALNNGNGIYLLSSNNNTLSGNNVSLNNRVGINLSHSSYNLIYNNNFKNTNNVGITNSTNTWNVTKTAGTNIIGGTYLGGNFWANESGTGFSQTCADVDKDGICDSAYALDSNNTDNLPLKRAPGFEAVFAIGGVLVVCLHAKKKRKLRT